MRVKLIIVAILFYSVTTFAQSFEVPANYSFSSDEDYKKYTKDIIAAANWLINTPVTEDAAKRRKVNDFVLNWSSGNPAFEVDVNEKIVTFLMCTDCLMVYIAGWSKYALENNDFTNKEKATIAGIKSVVEFYSKNKDALGKEKAVAKYAKMVKKGKLEKFVQKTLAE